MRLPSPRSRWRDDPIRTEVFSRPGGGVRTITHLDARSRRRYGIAVAAVTPRVERALADGVVANRARSTPTDVALEPWAAARRRYAHSMASTAAGPWRAAFVGDVRDCYGSIDPPVVDRALREIGVAQQPIERIVEVLRRFDDHGVRGLPIGPEPSAVLANAVLASVDRSLMGEFGTPSFRWVDDIVVFARDRREAWRAAATFARTLDALGLQAHPTKCRVVVDPDALLEGVSRRSIATGSARGMMRPP